MDIRELLKTSEEFDYQITKTRQHTDPFSLEFDIILSIDEYDFYIEAYVDFEIVDESYQDVFGMVERIALDISDVDLFFLFENEPSFTLKLSDLNQKISATLLEEFEQRSNL